MYYRKYQDPNPVESYTDRVGWWGWKGTGGSVMQWHRKHRVAFGYAPTKIRYLSICMGVLRGVGVARGALLL